MHLPIGGFSPGDWLVLIEHELLLFAGIFFLLGAIDEIAVDCAWFWLRLTGRARACKLSDGNPAPLAGQAAIFIPAWREAEIIGATIDHALAAWPQADLRSTWAVIATTRRPRRPSRQRPAAIPACGW